MNIGKCMLAWDRNLRASSTKKNSTNNGRVRDLQGRGLKPEEVICGGGGWITSLVFAFKISSDYGRLRWERVSKPVGVMLNDFAQTSSTGVIFGVDHESDISFQYDGER